MTTQKKWYKIAMALIAAAVLIGVFVKYQHYFGGMFKLLISSQAEWSSKSNVQTLAGSVAKLQDDLLVLSVGEQNLLSSISVAVSSSTRVVKNIPMSPADTAAAYKEFLRLQGESGGKPFTPPTSSTQILLKLSDLKKGDSILVTLTPDSTQEHFTAEIIEVLQSQLK